MQVINNQEVISKLRNKFSLNLYEVKIWIALLSKGISTAGELSDAANVPRSRTYDVLEGLEKKGFVIMKLSKPIKYLAVKPLNVIESYKKNIIKTAENKVKIIDDLKDSPIIEKLNHLHNQGVKFIKPTELSGVIKGRNNIYNYMNNMIKSAEKSIIISTSINGFVRKMKSFKNELSLARERGVDVKIVTSFNTDTRTYLNGIKDDIGSLKDGKNELSRFLIVDDKDVLFLLVNDDSVHPKYDVGLWVKSNVFGKSLNRMFNYMWEKLD